MKKYFLISRMAILLLFCVVLFGATAQAQMCFEFEHDEAGCKKTLGCYWCATMASCYPFSTCVECERVDEATCKKSSVCRWCESEGICHPNEGPCCGDGVVQAPEQCDSGRNCKPNCTCPAGMIPDGGNGCKPLQVCGNGILEGNEQCEGADGNLPPYCVNCQCIPHYSPDPEWAGYCKYTGNNDPVLDPIGKQQAYEGQLLHFTITAWDPDGDGLIYSASNLPDGATFDPATREFNWTPSYDQAGNYKVLFTVTDDWTPPASNCEEITITVEDVNRPPELASIGNWKVQEGGLLQFTITASDPDGNGLTYLASSLPDGATFDTATREFIWTPSYDQAGNYKVLFTVTDNGTPPESDSEEITITVGDVNRPPILNPIGNKTVTEGDPLEIIVTATDPDGDDLTYLASSLPDGATFDPVTQKFGWTPGYDQAGNYKVLFTVTDNGTPPESDFEEITIRVNNVVLQATIDINPDTLNLKSKGGENSMTVYIELPGGYDVRQIQVSSLRLNVNGKMISAQPAPTSIGDYDRDRIVDLMVKFDRQAVIDALGNRTGMITLTVIGKLSSGVGFIGSDTIKVINPGK